MGRRTENPKIEVVYVPTKRTPDEERLPVDIIADWIVRDLEKERLALMNEGEGNDSRR